MFDSEDVFLWLSFVCVWWSEQFYCIISECLKSYGCYVCVCVCVCRCLEFDEQPPVEYSKQLVLSCVLHCCQKLSHEGTSVDAVVKQALNVESVVQCIRASQNPHTHHHALLLLAHVAGIMPVSVCLSGRIISRILSYTVPCPLYDGLPQQLCITSQLCTLVSSVSLEQPGC